MLYISINIGSVLYIVRLYSHISNKYLATVTADEVVVPVCPGLVLMHYDTHMNKVQQRGIEDILYDGLLCKKDISF